MCRHRTTHAMDQRDLSLGDLPGVALASQLPDRLHDVEDAARGSWVRMREQAAVCVDRHAAVESDALAIDVLAALALRAESEILQECDHADREAVIDRRDVD